MSPFHRPRPNTPRRSSRSETPDCARSACTSAAGSHIVEKLYEAGEQDIIAFDILDFDSRLDGVTYIQGTVLNKEHLLELTKNVDYIHHNAALVPLTKSGRDFYSVNVIGTRNIVECCEKHHVKKLIHMSSSAIYGLPEAMPITETTGYAPIEVYGQSKLDGEKEVWQYMEKGGSASCIRPRTIIGGKSRLGIFQILFEWISEGRNIYVIGDGHNLFQFVQIFNFRANKFAPIALLPQVGVFSYDTHYLDRLIRLMRRGK